MITYGMRFVKKTEDEKTKKKIFPALIIKNFPPSEIISAVDIKVFDENGPFPEFNCCDPFFGPEIWHPVKRIQIGDNLSEKFAPFSEPNEMPTPTPTPTPTLMR